MIHDACSFDYDTAPSCHRSERVYRVRIIDFENLGTKFEGAPVNQLCQCMSMEVVPNSKQKAENVCRVSTYHCGQHHLAISWNTLIHRQNGLHGHGHQMDDVLGSSSPSPG